ncbi:MAG: DUF4091 domain-containing protein, partial [Deltaproteobacteria bacterium]|nr:DUF4091 domain-containing protein [Deltaproteobacteria bacterium]
PSGIGYAWATQQQLQGWEKAILAEPGLKNAWAYVTDEPSDMSGTAARAQLVRQYAPHLQTMVTTEPNSTLLGLIDHFVVVFEWFKQSGHWQDYSQAPNYWLYGSCMSHGSCTNSTTGHLTRTPDMMLDEPDVNGRAFSLVAYSMGAQAALYYNSTEAFGQLDPWTSQYLFGGNGDGTLLYPGISGQHGLTSNQAVASIRMKAMRQGQYDVEYFKWASSAGLAASVKSIVPDQFNWSRNNGDYDNLRQQIGNALSP